MQATEPQKEKAVKPATKTTEKESTDKSKTVKGTDSKVQNVKKDKKQ
jgi:hypothetical protein